MEFGRNRNAIDVDFFLNETPVCTINHLQRIASPSKKEFYIGGTGWHMKEWVGSWYPLGTKPTVYLQEYGRQFNAIECNTTFYKIPDTVAIGKWRKSVQSGFRFCPKVYQGISRSEDFGAKDRLMDRYWEAIQCLEQQLGVVFMQLSENFSVESIAKLIEFLETCPSDVPLFIELRHPSWFDEQTDALPLMQLLRDCQYGWVITDVAGRRDVLHQNVTTDTVMIRFVACGIDSIDHQRLGVWAERLKLWYNYGLKKVYFFVHDFDGAKVPVLIASMIALMKMAVPSLTITMPVDYSVSAKQLTLF